MSSADERIINRLQKIYDAQGAGGAAFADITGEPTENAALNAALAAKVPTSRTVNGQALSGNVVVTGRMLDTAGAPDNGVGNNGDYAFDDATKTMYGPKAGGVWPAGVVLGGAVSVSKGILSILGANSSIATLSGIQYYCPGVPITSPGFTGLPENAFAFVVPFDLTLKNLNVRTGTSMKEEDPVTVITVRKNGADTALTVTMTQTINTTTTDSTNSVSYAAGDRLTVSVLTTGTDAISAAIANITMEYDAQ